MVACFVVMVSWKWWADLTARYFELAWNLLRKSGNLWDVDVDVDVDILGKSKRHSNPVSTQLENSPSTACSNLFMFVSCFSQQVKIRGMRVELGEIESGVVKAAAGLLSNCAVKLREGGFLVAYCQARCHV